MSSIAFQTSAADTMEGVDSFIGSVSHEMIDVVFQPIVNLETGTAVGFEVLSRGRGQHVGISGLLARAREKGATWAFERACWTAAFREIAALDPRARAFTFFLNLSPAAICDPRFGELLPPVSGAIDARHIVLEITEQESIRDHQRFERAIAECASRGMRIALDDFGSGHNGLATLVACRPDFVKLDVSLTRDLNAGSYRARVIDSIVALARNVGANLIAEGVESWGEVAALREAGIRIAQGFALGRPSRYPGPLAQEVRWRLCA